MNHPRRERGSQVEHKQKRTHLLTLDVRHANAGTIVFSWEQKSAGRSAWFYGGYSKGLCARGGAPPQLFHYRS